MRALIVGSGAVGQYLAARLMQGGHDVVIMGRPELAQRINARGITLHTDGGRATFPLRAVAEIADPALDVPFELAIVAVKSYSTAEAAHAISSIPACNRASILTVQNGIGNEEELAEAFGPDRVIAGALTVAVDRLDATTILGSKKGGLCIAPVGGSPHNWVIAAASSSGLPVRAVPDWRALKWSKLCINLLGNGVCAALDWPPERVYADRTAFGIDRACLLEAIDVMNKLGLAATNLVDFPVALLVRAATLLPSSTLRVVLARRVAGGRGGKLPSLLMDLRAGKHQTEVAALNGAVARHAADTGSSAPANAKVSHVVSGIAAGTISWDEYRSHPEKLM